MKKIFIVLLAILSLGVFTTVNAAENSAVSGTGKVQFAEDLSKVTIYAALRVENNIEVYNNEDILSILGLSSGTIKASFDGDSTKAKVYVIENEAALENIDLSTLVEFNGTKIDAGKVIVIVGESDQITQEHTITFSYYDRNYGVIDYTFKYDGTDYPNHSFGASGKSGIPLDSSESMSNTITILENIKNDFGIYPTVDSNGNLTFTFSNNKTYEANLNNLNSQSYSYIKSRLEDISWEMTADEQAKYDAIVEYAKSKGFEIINKYVDKDWLSLDNEKKIGETYFSKYIGVENWRNITLEEIYKIIDPQIAEPAYTYIEKENIDSNLLNDIKNYGDKITIMSNDYYDEKNDKYANFSWIFDGKQITDTNYNIDKNVNINKGDNMEYINSLIGDKQKLNLDFKYEGKLPTGTQFRLYVKDFFGDGDYLTLKYYNPTTKQLEDVLYNVKVENGYVTFGLEHCSEYVLVKQDNYIEVINDSSKNPQTSGINVVGYSIISILSLLGFGYILKHKTNE